MISFSEPSKEARKNLIEILAPESTEARAVVEKHKEKIIADAIQAAKFLELIFPDEDITIFSRLYHVVIEKTGLIYTFDIAVRRCSMFQSWNVLQERSHFEMPSQDRWFLSKQFDWRRS